MSDNSYIEQAPLDPVLSACELPLRRTFYPYGFPLELETNSPDVIAAASEGWDAFPQMFDEAPVRMCLGVLEHSGDVLAPESAVRSREHMMSIVSDPANFMVCDFNRGFAFGWVTQNTAADHPLLRYRFLTAGGGTLVEQRAFSSLHGALVVRNGTGVMLCGDSFAGKSTLAYACARAGWTYVSDDGAYVVRSRDDRFTIGDPHGIRFRPDAPDLFPELADFLPRIRPNGKIGVEVRTRELPIAIASGCTVEHVVYLNRNRHREHAGRARLGHYSKDRVREEWTKFLSLGTQDVREDQRRCQERILSAPLWEMQYSDLDDAIARLERLVDHGA
jgi:hypothetical protein